MPKLGGCRLIGGEVGRFGKHFHILKNIPTSRAGLYQNTTHLRNCFHSHDCFLQIGGWYVACYGKIFVLLYFV